MHKTILQNGRKYTFSDYFELNYPTEEIVAELGYEFSQQLLQLPHSINYNIRDANKLKKMLYTVLPNIAINSEMAKREFLIAPILFEVIKATQAKVNVEYMLDVNEKLSGSLDYLIRLRHEIIVIEAKKGDLERGFTQLAAELIALDKSIEDITDNILYGAISIGHLWRFGTLLRNERHIIQDVNSYKVPGDIKEVISILVGILTSYNLLTQF